VRWAEIGWQVDYEPYDHATSSFDSISGFEFDRGKYESLLRNSRHQFE